MKQGIANIWLLGMIVVFIAMFSAYIITTINYSKSFKLKNEMLTIIEKHHGMTFSGGESGTSIINGSEVKVNVGALQTINLYLLGNGYTQKGKCPAPSSSDEPGTWYGVKDIGVGDASAMLNKSNLSDLAVEITSSNANDTYYWCFAKYKGQQSKSSFYTSAYYKVRLFYGFDVFSSFNTLVAIKVDGTTDEIFNVQDGDDSNPNKIKVSTNSMDYNGNSGARNLGDV